MPRGTKISSEMQWVILQLSKFPKNDQIATCVGVSERAIRSVISHFREHGTVEGDVSIQEKVKQNRHLRDLDVEVRVFSLLCSKSWAYHLHLVLAWGCQSTTWFVPWRTQGDAWNWLRCQRFELYHLANTPTGRIYNEESELISLCIGLLGSTQIPSSSHVFQQSDLQRSASSILQGLASTLQSNLSSLMSPLLIAEQHIEVVHGLFVEPRHSVRLSLCADDGKYVWSSGQ
jgi:hypothetical protein